MSFYIQPAQILFVLTHIKVWLAVLFSVPLSEIKQVLKYSNIFNDISWKLQTN